MVEWEWIIMYVGREHWALITNSPPLYFTRDLRWPYLSLHDERYGRKACQRAPKPPWAAVKV